MNKLKDSKGLYWGLIITFFVLYALVSFVSTLHSITFFELANTMGLAILLGITYEIGQATVLFSLLMSKNNQKLLPWTLMILLTSLQVTANVYASFKFMDNSGNMDWTYWQRSILFWLEADGPEMFKVIISWISGALLPIVALGMTALVAENLKLKDEEPETINHKEEIKDEPKIIEKEIKSSEEIEDTLPDSITMDYADKIIYDVPTKKEIEEKPVEIENNFINFPDLVSLNELYENDLSSLQSEEDRLNQLYDNMHVGSATPYESMAKEIVSGVVEEKAPIEINLSPSKEDVMANMAHTLEYDIESIPINTKSDSKLDTVISTGNILEKLPEIVEEKKPIKRTRGWHLKQLYEDTNGDIYSFGVYQQNPESLKKVTE